LWGADVAQLRTLAEQFGKTSDTLLQQSSTLTSAINGTAAWKGADSARFTSEWNGSHRALIQKTALALKAESRRLLTNAEEQEKASNAAPGSGGGPGSASGGGADGSGSGPLRHGDALGFIGGGLLGLAGFVRAGMKYQKYIKAPLTLAKAAGQYGWVLKNQRTELAEALLTKGRHRLGGPVFDSRHLWQTTAGNKTLEGLLKDSTQGSRTLNAIDSASDAASLKNLNKFVKPLDKLGRLVAEKPWIGADTKLEWLGKSGLARGLGWAGVGFSTVDSVQAFAHGDVEKGLGSAFKAGLGVGCFLPPPAGTVCQVASVGVAVYENWDTISSVGKNIGEGIADAVKDPGAFVSNAADTLKDAGKSVANFFRF
jgi:uncharacterized protein YukE